MKRNRSFVLVSLLTLVAVILAACAGGGGGSAAGGLPKVTKKDTY